MTDEFKNWFEHIERLSNEFLGIVNTERSRCLKKFRIEGRIFPCQLAKIHPDEHCFKGKNFSIEWDAD